MDIGRTSQLFIFLVCTILYVMSACPRCSNKPFLAKFCESGSDFIIGGRVVNITRMKSEQDTTIFYKLGFNTMYLGRSWDFKTAEKVIKTKIQPGINDCSVPKTEFISGHYYVFIGNIITEDSRKLLEVKRCYYKDFERIVKDSSTMSQLAALKRTTFCPNANSAHKVDSMINTFKTRKPKK